MNQYGPKLFGDEVGVVKVGMKQIKIKAITTEIVSAGGGDLGIQDGLNVRTITNKVAETGFQPGDRATLFWCSNGDRDSDWAAGYNHRTGASGVSPHGLNELITPPFYKAMSITAIFVGLFALLAVFQGKGAAILVVLVCIVPFVLVSRRHKKVKRAIESAMIEIKKDDMALR